MAPAKKKSQAKPGPTPTPSSSSSHQTSKPMTRSNSSIRKIDSSSSNDLNLPITTNASKVRSKRKRDVEQLDDCEEEESVQEAVSVLVQANIDQVEANKESKKMSVSKKTKMADNMSLITYKIQELKDIIGSISTMQELSHTALQLLGVKMMIQKKMKQKRSAAELKAKNKSDNEEEGQPAHPLLTQVVLEHLVKYIALDELPKCRLVCKRWNEIVSAHLKRIYWTNLTNEDEPTNPQDLSLEKFITDITPNSILFPLTKFTLTIDNIPPSAPVKKLFNTYAEYIKKLDLRLQLEEAKPAVIFNELARYLFPSLTNCENLYLTNFTCQAFLAKSGRIHHKMDKLRHLDIDLHCTCLNDHHDFTIDTLLSKLVTCNRKVESYNIIVNSKEFSLAIVDSFIKLLLVQAELSNLKHLGLSSAANIVRLPDVPRLSFLQLKSLELKNIIATPMQDILGLQMNTLEKLVIDMDVDKWESWKQNEGAEHNLELYPKLKMPKLKSFSGICLEDQEEGLNELLTSGLFPKLDSLKLFNVNENFVQAHATKLRRLNNQNNNEDHNSDSENEDDEDSDKHLIHIKHLELDIDDSDSPSNDRFMKNIFRSVQHLILTTNQSKYITSLWSCPFKLKTLHLHVADEESEDEFYVQHLDTIITGFSVNDCEKVYQLINKHFHSQAGFNLETFNVNWLENICLEKQYPSVRNFGDLQRVSITCDRNSSRLTEVTLATLLLYNKSLTAIKITNCSINQNFVKHIRNQLPPGFFLDIEGVLL